MAQYRQRGILWLLIFVISLAFLTLEIEISDREGTAFSHWCVGSAMASGDLADINEAAGKKEYKAGIKAYKSKNYRKAMKHWQRSLLLIERLEDENDKARRTANVQYNMGQALRNLKRCDEALPYYKKALQYYNEAQAQTNESKTYFNIGRCQNNLKRYADAATAFDNSAVIGRSCGVNPDMILEAQRLQKEARAKANERGHGEPVDGYQNGRELPGEDDEYYQDEPEPFIENDERYPKDRGPENGHDEHYPEDHGPVGEQDEYYPEDRGPEDGRDEHYPEDHGPAGERDEYYPEDRGPENGHDEHYPEDHGPAGEQDEYYPEDSGPENGHDEYYPEDHGPAGEQDEHYPEE